MSFIANIYHSLLKPNQYDFGLKVNFIVFNKILHLLKNHSFLLKIKRFAQILFASLERREIKDLE